MSTLSDPRLYPGSGPLTSSAPVVQRKCACGRDLSADETECEACQAQKAGLQTKLALGRPGDHLEREADRVADEVLRMPGTPAFRLSGGRPGICRRGVQPEGAGRQVPDSVAATLGQPGEPLPAATRAFFEPRFGHDFSQVRVHRDTSAAASAEAIAAHAYAFGNHLVFARGRFAPASMDGRRLLAHELAHVVQQRGGSPGIQREGEKEEEKQSASKKDVSIVLTDEGQDMDEGRTYAKTALRVTSVEDAVKQLKALKSPIGTLYVVSHSSSAGQIQFVSGIGTTSWVDIGKLADAMKGQVNAETVDFRGCKLGSAQAKMESFRKTAGAQSVKGSNCWTFVARVTPLVYKDAEITKPSQIPKGMERAFDRALLRQVNGLRAANKKPVRNCLLGLQKGERAGRSTLKKIWAQYWANNGNLVASWGSPKYNEDWQKGSICSNHMTASTKPCAIVEAKGKAGGAKQPATSVIGQGTVQSGGSVEQTPAVREEQGDGD